MDDFTELGSYIEDEMSEGGDHTAVTAVVNDWLNGTL